MMLPLACLLWFAALLPAQRLPNIVLIYSDDVGYGDLGCYGATLIRTPHLDRLAAGGLRFTNAHSSSATCTPSRYSLLTGTYAWRKKGTGVAPGNAPLLIEPGKAALPETLRRAGYATAAVGKWHLGLGTASGPDWNGELKPGPPELGFDYAFIYPATNDRVPCVYVENHRVVGLDPADPITVSYREKTGDEPTGREHPELLRLQATEGHDQTIVNGVGRIGYMKGGKTARWKDEDLADTLCNKALRFIASHCGQPFFLYFAPADIHVPRLPHPRFAGKSGLGPRGDALLQLDWTVGRILRTLDSLGLASNTLVVFSSDNGPVVPDGYADGSLEKLNGHRPAGPFRGGKYSNFEAGTRVPFLVRWPGKVRRGTSNALLSHVDLSATFAALCRQNLPDSTATDSRNLLQTLLGRSARGRDQLVEHAGSFSLVRGNWKYIEPGKGPARDNHTRIELGNLEQPQLYDLRTDPGETRNLAARYPRKTKSLAAELERIKNNTRR